MKLQRMNPFNARDLLPINRPTADEPEKKEEQQESNEKQEPKAGPVEWIWFIAWGLLLPMLFYLYYGIVGLLLGLVLFALYLLLVYVSVKTEDERQGLEEKAERLQEFVDRRKENLVRTNRKALDAIQKSVVRNIPGFRTRTPWKMVVATFFYLFTIMILIVATLQGSYGLALLIGLTALLFVSGTQDEMM